MSEVALKCDGLSKAYHLGETLSLSHTLQVMNPFRRAQPKDEFMALDDVTFSVSKGSFFGIVGSNGSGKSTLTQVISGITVPSSGQAEVHGRVLPLLEVGAGFSEELTGRENVYLLGAILGVDSSQVAESVSEIVEFAGVEAHFDSPLKRYSSGMKARLAFASAIFFPADIYVFDEVLAVVDDDFREECIEQMKRLNAQGATIIFMSHDLDLVEEVCDEGLWLEKGVVRQVGSMADVAARYKGSLEAA